MTLRCINCTLRIARIRRHRLYEESDQTLERVRQWVYPRDVSGADYLCHACWELMHQNTQQLPSLQPAQHNVCATCGRSILRIRSRLVVRPDLTDRETAIGNIIAEWIQPRQLQPMDEVCIPCWLRAQRVADRRRNEEVEAAERSNQPTTSQENQQDQLGPSNQPTTSRESSNQQQQAGPSNRPTTSRESSNQQQQAGPLNRPTTSQESINQQEQAGSSNRPTTSQENNNQQEQAGHSTESEPEITLPSLRRAAATARRCMFLECDDHEKRRVPDSIRRRIIVDYNFYIPINARICEYHLGSNSFHELYAAENALSTFSAEHIEDVVFMLREDRQLDFSQPETIDDYLFKYWFGRTKREYNDILAQVPRLNSARIKIGFNALLCKMRTGDSDERISALFQVPRRTLEGYMSQAREILLQDYVPQHLGFNHITREEIVARNSYLADHLFGNPEDPVENRHIIAIVDGTYLNTQKSSNYAFQKNTYSLHKNRTLVKPFMIVCCDGYIIDTLGPYAATKNDAAIMKDLLENGAFSELFREDDIFIVDRGFRDCIDDMAQKGFQAHMPETISEGERQLTTLQANKTRCITMNRWVVEAVNGRFSRDFKIFRADFVNKSCPHIMQDYSIAAALINHFAVQFTERRNVEIILDIIGEKMFQDNLLGLIVRQNNLNMRHTMFHNINRSNITFPELSIEDLELIALGTYQIRQAKSYVGEHFRAHGMYTIEVARNEDNARILAAFNGVDPFVLRAKIKSRHIGSRSYFAYIVVDRGMQGRQAILGYYCHCAAGKRTVGCCSHTMSVLWYMGLARRQGHFEAPAAFLDNLLIT